VEFSWELFGVKRRIMLHRNKSTEAMPRRNNPDPRLHRTTQPKPESKNPPPPCGSGGLLMGK
jgi:hypothetical protein